MQTTNRSLPPESRRPHCASNWNLVWTSLLAAMMFTFEVFSQNAVTLRGRVDITGGYGDVWGYVDPNTGKEYALVGTGAGLHIVDASDPTNPFEVAFVGTVPGFDVKAWQHYAYTVNGGPSGLGGIVDISDPTNPQVVGQFPSSHNHFIAENGYMYLESSGLRIFDLNLDPTNPQLVWSLGTSGHDASVIGDLLFDFHSSVTNIYNVTTPANPLLLSTIQTPLIAYHHSGWTSSDGNYLFICDELNEFRTTPIADITVWDISNLANPQQVGQWQDPNSSVHNLYVIGDYAFVSYYAAGFRVFDISTPSNPVLAGEYDTSPSAGPGFDGAFGAYPYSPSGTIYVNSTTERSLFLFEFTGGEPGTVQGTIRSRGNTSSVPLAGATIRPARTFSNAGSDANGQYSLRLPKGDYTMEAFAFGHHPATAAVTVPANGSVTLDVELEPLATGQLAGTIRASNTGAALSATVTLWAGGKLAGTTRSDEDGSYSIDNLYITSPGIKYTEMLVLPDFDYPAVTLTEEIIITAETTTIRDVSLAPAALTIVDDDDGAEYETQFGASLDSLGLSYFRWDVAKRGEIGDSLQLLTSSTVVYFTGDPGNQPPLTPDKASSLASFLKNDGKLLLTGQGIVAGLDTSHPLIQNFLQVTSTGTTTDFIINGIAGDVITDGMLLQTRGTTNNQTAMEVLAPFGTATPIFNYGPTGANGVAGIRAEGVTWKAAFLGFGFEAVNNISGNSRVTDPEMLLASILNWFDTPTGVENEHPQVPRASALAQNYPNPFNPATTIRYEVHAPSQVTLAVYSVSGQVLRMLINSLQPAGSFQARWDGRDDNGNAVASGIYLYKLVVQPNAGNASGENDLRETSFIRKMTLVR